MRNKKLQVWLPLLFSLVMIIGMVFGFKLNQQTGSSGSFFKRDKRTSLQEALDLIKDRYVDNIGIDSLQDDAINEVMNHLDPHSVYIPASDVTSANEDLVGNFEGIGVEFNIFEDTVHVLYVMPSGPSDIAGLRIGDKIIKVEKELIDKNAFFTATEIMADLALNEIQVANFQFDQQYCVECKVELPKSKKKKAKKWVVGVAVQLIGR